MSDHGSNMEHIRKHLSMAIEAFDKCLEPTGRPHLSMCELGVARSLNMAAKLLYEADDASDESIRISFERDAKIAYTNLLNNWAQVNGNGTLCSSAKRENITLLIHLLRGFTLNITTRTRILNSNTNARTQVRTIQREKVSHVKVPFQRQNHTLLMVPRTNRKRV